MHTVHAAIETLALGNCHTLLHTCHTCLLLPTGDISAVCLLDGSDSLSMALSIMSMLCRMSVLGAIIVLNAAVAVRVGQISWQACRTYARAVRALQQPDSSV